MPKVLFAEDHPIVIRGMKVMFETEFDGCELTFVSKTTDLMSCLKKDIYDMAVIDMQLEDGDTLHLITDIRKLYPKVNIVIFSGNAEELYANKVYQQGAKGYVSKLSQDSEIVIAFRQVLEGKTYMSENFKQFLLKSQLAANESPFQALSQREMEVVNLMVKGKRSSEICEELNLQSSTVATFKAKIFSKLSITNVLELKQLVSNYQPI